MPMGARSDARKQARYKTWHLQGFAQIENPFPPPRFTQELGDKAEIRGRFIPAQDDLSSQMFQGGRGRFVAPKVQVDASGREFKLLLNDILRNEQGKYIKLISDEIESSENATEQLQVWAAEVVSRTIEEQAASRLAGDPDNPNLGV